MIHHLIGHENRTFDRNEKGLVLQSEGSPMAHKTTTIYVIDDDESVRRSFERLLRSAKLDAKTFSCAEEFLNSLRKSETGCIIMDLRMPGLTGFDLQKKIASQGIRMPVIVISASDDAQSRERARELGAVAFFRKPVDDQALLDAIFWAIGGKGKGKQ
jgi:FixJ family two-component response regulator